MMEDTGRRLPHLACQFGDGGFGTRSNPAQNIWYFFFSFYAFFFFMTTYIPTSVHQSDCFCLKTDLFSFACQSMTFSVPPSTRGSLLTFRSLAFCGVVSINIPPGTSTCSPHHGARHGALFVDFFFSSFLSRLVKNVLLSVQSMCQSTVQQNASHRSYYRVIMLLTYNYNYSQPGIPARYSVFYCSCLSSPVLKLFVYIESIMCLLLFTWCLMSSCCLLSCAGGGACCLLSYSVAQVRLQSSVVELLSLLLGLDISFTLPLSV